VESREVDAVYDTGLSLTAGNDVVYNNGAVYAQTDGWGLPHRALTARYGSLLRGVEASVEDGTTYRFDTGAATSG